MGYTVEPQTTITAADAYKFAAGVVPHSIDSNGLAVPQSATSPQPVAGVPFTSTATLTRTADTNAYLAGDVLGAATGSTAALTFANIGPAAGGEVLINYSTFRIDKNAVPSGMTGFRLRLYSVTPPSAIGDNGVWDIASGDRASYLGFIDLGTPVDEGSTLWVESTQQKTVTVPAGGSLSAYLVTTTGYTPASADVHAITLKASSF